MTGDYADAYHEIVAGLDEREVAALWNAALFGGRRAPAALQDRVLALVELRDRMANDTVARRERPPGSVCG